jgi:DNA-binding MarR family transcriptional regulator
VARGTQTGTDADADATRLLTGIRVLVRRFSISERADVSCCGMTVAQAATLEVLRAEGPLRLGALGRRLGITPSTLTRNLARLEERGLVKREMDREDARSALVRLSEAGVKAAAGVGRQEQAFARSVLERLPEARRTAALQALGDLLAAVREATESCCPGAFEHLMTGIPRAAARGEGRRDETGCCGNE